MKKIIFILFSLTLLVGCQQVDDLKSNWLKIKELADKVQNSNISLNTGNGQHVVIVPGYGAPVKGNDTYEKYIAKVAEFVKDKNNSVDILIFTGSYSSLKDTSEAAAMHSYFNSLVDTNELANQGLHVYQEECAIVSWQNIANSYELLNEKKVNPSKVTIFGDVAREEKLVAFATYKFNNNQEITKKGSGVDINLSYTDIDFQGFDFHTNASEQKEKLAIEMAGAYDTETGNEILKKRIGDWSKQFNYNVADNLVDQGCLEFKGFR